MLAVYKKELRSYFTSMIGYVFIALFLAIIGVSFFIQNLVNGLANFAETMSGITIVFLILVPLLTMRLMAEENKQKTDQLLYTSPLTASAIVLGKFLAVFTVFGIVMLVTSTYPLIMMLFGTVSVATSYAGILGFTLLGASYLSIGLYISSLTESQVVAAIISFVVFFFTLMMDGLANILPSDNKSAFIIFTVFILVLCIIVYLMMRNLIVTVGVGILCEAGLIVAYLLKPTIFDGSIVSVFGWFSIISRFENFYYGIFDVSAIIYYLSITFLFIFLTTQVIKKKRWS